MLGTVLLGSQAPRSPPDKVTGVTLSQPADTSMLTITWGAPTNTGSAALTGYGILGRRVGNPWPLDIQAAVAGAEDTTYTYSGLTDGLNYGVKIRACNGENSCSGWSDEVTLRLTGPPPPSNAPAQPHSIRFDDPVGTMAFVVRWRPDADTGGTDLTGFGILVRQRESQWPLESATTWVGASTRSHLVSGLTAGTVYVVKIRACNGDDGQSNCSSWSADGRVRTELVEFTRPSTIPVVSNPVTPV